MTDDRPIIRRVVEGSRMKRWVILAEFISTNQKFVPEVYEDKWEAFVQFANLQEFWPDVRCAIACMTLEPTRKSK